MKFDNLAHMQTLVVVFVSLSIGITLRLLTICDSCHQPVCFATTLCDTMCDAGRNARTIIIHMWRRSPSILTILVIIQLFSFSLSGIGRNSTKRERMRNNRMSIIRGNRSVEIDAYTGVRSTRVRRSLKICVCVLAF